MEVGDDLTGKTERFSNVDFRDYDKIEVAEFKEILWCAVKGEDVPLPPTIRRALVERQLISPR